MGTRLWMFGTVQDVNLVLKRKTRLGVGTGRPMISV